MRHGCRLRVNPVPDRASAPTLQPWQFFALLALVSAAGAVTVLRSTDSAPIASASILITVHNSKSGGTTTGTVTTNTKGIATWSFNGANPTFNYPVDAFKVWDAQATVSGFATGSVLQIPVTTFVFDNDTTHNSTNNNCTIYLTPH